MAPSRLSSQESSEVGASDLPRGVALLALLLGIGLNQSRILAGYNQSIADVFMVILLCAMSVSRKLLMPRGPTMFFVLLSITTLTMSLVVPTLLSVPVAYLATIGNYVKLVVVFLYFTIGYNLTRYRIADTVIRGFVAGSVIIGATAVLSLFTGALASSDVLFFGGFRFRGLMNDPNYFSVIQVAAAALLARDRRMPTAARYLGIGVLIFSVLLSGSKTGAIAAGLWMLWALLTRSFEIAANPKSTQVLGLLAIGVSGAVILTLAVSPELAVVLGRQTESVPALKRVSMLLLNPDLAVEGEGSGRSTAWHAAIRIIGLSPLFGVGVGSYVVLNEALNGERVLAHNTPFQLAAEWGVVFTALFGAWLFLLALRRPTDVETLDMWRAVRDGVLILVVGSLGISLNNARVFWLLLGILAALHVSTERSVKRHRTRQN